MVNEYIQNGFCSSFNCSNCASKSSVSSKSFLTNTPRKSPSWYTLEPKPCGKLDKIESKPPIAFDTTLRDGFQQEGISPSVKDKLAIAKLIDELGVSFIEGGWPGASPKEEEFFLKAKDELDLKNAKL